MRFTIDTNNKTVEILEEVSILEFSTKLKIMGIDLEEYKIIPTRVPYVSTPYINWQPCDTSSYKITCSPSSFS